MRLGPCCVCGAQDYELSCGGPTICPQCDCGNFTHGTVIHQSQELARLRARLAQATSILTNVSSLNKPPPGIPQEMLVGMATASARKFLEEETAALPSQAQKTGGGA